jgi:hypothetical protein
LSEAELQQVAEYVAFLRFRARIGPLPVIDATQIATLYARFADEDRAFGGRRVWRTIASKLHDEDAQ